jgi:hypothetical protein
MWVQTAGFAQHVDDARWQIRYRSGGDVDLWGNPNADAWSAPIQTQCSGSFVVCSPCASGAATPDRVVFTITLQDYEPSVAVWAQKIRTAVATIRLHHPQVEQIVLQPLVGGPAHAPCPYSGIPEGVRAAYNHPYIDAAIAEVVGDSPDLVAGASPEVRTCADYEDDVGHLVEPSRSPIGDAIGQVYDEGD